MDLDEEEVPEFTDDGLGGLPELPLAEAIP